MIENNPSNMSSAFTPEAALKYVNSLRDEARRRATEYIRNAPPEVATPFRRLFSPETVLDNRGNGHAQERPR